MKKGIINIWLARLYGAIINSFIFIGFILVLMLLSSPESVLTHWGKMLHGIRSLLFDADGKQFFSKGEFWGGAITSAIIAIPVAFLWNYVQHFIKKQRPSCRLWKFKKPESCVIIISCTPRSIEKKPNKNDIVEENTQITVPINPLTNTVPTVIIPEEVKPSPDREECRKHEITRIMLKLKQSLDEGFLPDLNAMLQNIPLRTVYCETRLDTGEGQLRALPFLISSLHDAYAEAINWSNLSLADSPKAELHAVGNDKDVILVGGSRTNQYTANCLRLINKMTKVHVSKLDGGGLDISAPPSKEHPNGVQKSYRVRRCFKASKEGKINRGRAYVIEEYSIIVRWQQAAEIMKNNRYYIFAGCTTHGTAIAAQFFCEQLAADPLLRKRKGDFLAVLKTEIEPHSGDDHGRPIVDIVIPLDMLPAEKPAAPAEKPAEEKLADKA